MVEDTDMSRQLFNALKNLGDHTKHLVARLVWSSTRADDSQPSWGCCPVAHQRAREEFDRMCEAESTRRQPTGGSHPL